MFDWSKEEVDNFYKNNIEKIAIKLESIYESSKYINKIRELGNQIYIITGRDNGEYSNPLSMTEEWLIKNNIKYDELILTNAYNHHEKANECVKHAVDIMIDDSVHVYNECLSKKIDTLLFDTKYNRQYNDMKRVYGWKEIYEYIINYKRDKINVILDTDTYNECDDQFALSYMLKSQDIFNVEAITIAPYSHNKTKKVTVQEGQVLSYNEVVKICNWLNFNTTDKVFKGSMDYMQNGYNEDNDAVNKIIEICRKNNRTYIMAIGAITNVALAIQKEPSIIGNIEIIWLGGHDLNQNDNLEYNFRQDVYAVKTIYNSGVKLTVIPCEEVASILKTDIDTLNERLKDKNELCNYLIDKFYDDGYHGINETRVIWDISVIAYMINNNWFETKEIKCPNIKEDTSYEFNDNGNMITMVTKINNEKIYEDLFEKLGE